MLNEHIVHHKCCVLLELPHLPAIKRGIICSFFCSNSNNANILNQTVWMAALLHVYWFSSYMLSGLSLSPITAVTALQRSHYKHLTKSFPNEVNIPLSGYVSVKKMNICLSENNNKQSKTTRRLSHKSQKYSYSSIPPTCLFSDKSPGSSSKAHGSGEGTPRRQRQRQIPKDTESEMQVERQRR